MTDIRDKTGGTISTLNVEEVLELHQILCDNYKLLPEMEPIVPAGVRDICLLESAVNRQFVGLGDYSKYDDFYSNCATLIYGIVQDHAFHNGNKRMGFLVMLKHLYKNGYVITPLTKHDEIYELLTSLASNKLQDHALAYGRAFIKVYGRSIWNDEMDVKYLAFWLRQNTEHKSVKIKLKTISLGQLQDILSSKGLHVSFDGRHLTVIRPIKVYKRLFGEKPLRRTYTIKKQNSVSLKIVEDIRRDFELAIKDGIDNISFYNDEHLLNEEIVSYKRIIYKLSKT